MPAGGKLPADANNSSESKQIFLSGGENISAVDQCGKFAKKDLNGIVTN
ncbi:MAG: hypothetical protein WBI40_11935 [Methylococcaceae bacterium]